MGAIYLVTAAWRGQSQPRCVCARPDWPAVCGRPLAYSDRLLMDESLLYVARRRLQPITADWRLFDGDEIDV